MNGEESSKSLRRRQRNRAIVGVGLVSALVSGLFGYVLPKQREEAKRFKQEQLEWAKKEAEFEKKRAQDDLDYEAQLRASKESGEALRTNVEEGKVLPRIYINSSTGKPIGFDYITNETESVSSKTNSFKNKSSKQRVGNGVSLNKLRMPSSKGNRSNPQALALGFALTRARARKSHSNKLKIRGLIRRR